MKGFAQVFLLELRLRKAVFPAALVAGLVPIPFAFAMTRSFSFKEAMDAGAFLFAALGGAILALVLGGTTLARDLSEGRSGFFFSRPVSSFALWVGKMSATWAIVLSAALLVLLPATLLGGGLVTWASAGSHPGSDTFMASPLVEALCVSLYFLFMIALSHAVSLMFRARSRWLILDGIMIVLLPAMGWWAAKHFLSFLGSWWFGGAADVLLGTVLIGLPVLLLALLVAGAVQTVVGRADMRRGHKALSLTLWLVLAPLVLLADGLAYKVEHVTPKDLASVEFTEVSCHTPWAIVGGPLRGAAWYAGATFLINTQSGAWVRMPGGRWDETPWISPDGKTALVSQAEEPGKTLVAEIVSYDLTVPGLPVPQTHGLMAGVNTEMAFSPDSSLLALLTDTNLSVIELSTWKLLAAQRLPTVEGRWEQFKPAFVDPDHVRIFRTSGALSKAGQPGGFTIWEFDATAKKLVETGRLDPSVSPYPIRLDSTGERMVASQWSGSEYHIVLCNARTGQALKTLCRSIHKTSSAFLPDGRILCTNRSASDNILSLFSAEGEPLRTFPLGEPRIVSLGPPVEGGRMLISTMIPKKWQSMDLRMLDLDTGAIKVLKEAGIQERWWSWGWRRATLARKEPITGEVFLDQQGHLNWYDFAKETQTPIPIR